MSTSDPQLPPGMFLSKDSVLGHRVYRIHDLTGLPQTVAYDKSLEVTVKMAWERHNGK